MHAPKPIRWLIASLALALAGCSTSTPFNLALDSLRLAWHGTNTTPITRASADQLPYASLLVSVGDAPPALVVLAKADGPERIWVSADKAMLATRAGRLVKTVGLRSNLVGVNTLMPDPVQTGLHRIDHGSRYSRGVDLMPGYHFGALAESEFTPVGIETVTILGSTRQLLHVTERLQIPELQFHARNDYWVDPKTGFVWQSRQTLGPDLPPVFFAVAKPFAGDLLP